MEKQRGDQEGGNSGENGKMEWWNIGYSDVACLPEFYEGRDAGFSILDAGYWFCDARYKNPNCASFECNGNEV